jgi:hypothetical protein
MSFSKGGTNWRKTDELKCLREHFTKMLVAARERGAGATGVFLVSRSKSAPSKGLRPDVIILRAPLPAEEFVETEQYKKLMKLVNNSMYTIVGHTRNATNGAATDPLNNHPHLTGKIIGVHNGTITNVNDIWKAINVSPKSSCDSEALFAAINWKYYKTMDMNTAMTGTVKLLQGFYSAAFVDLMNPTKTYLIRDHKVPLYAGRWTYGEVTFFASQKEYMEDGFPEGLRKNRGVNGGLQGLHIPSMTLVHTDYHRNPPATWPFPHDLSSAGMSEEAQKKLIAENQAVFNVTQGQGVSSADENKRRKA